VAAIAMHINFIRSLLIKNPRQALEELEKVERLAKDTSKEIRGMLFTLRPLILESDGLAAAIETLMDKLRENDKMNVRLLGADAADLISGQAQGITFSIIEEAIGNARKYSDAKLVEVKLWKEDDLFVAQIEDDGVGFDVENVVSNYSSRGSLGLVNMRERAARIDGSLKIESEPGQGTVITLIIPLDKHGNQRSPNGAGAA
jgi:signal transduction histidine kinase